MIIYGLKNFSEFSVLSSTVKTFKLMKYLKSHSILSPIIWDSDLPPMIKSSRMKSFNFLYLYYNSCFKVS